MKNNDGKLISTTEALALLGVSSGTLRNLIRAGRLEPFSTNPGGRVRWITKASLDRLFNRNTCK